MGETERELIGYLITSVKKLGELDGSLIELTKDNAGVDRMYPLYRRRSASFDIRTQLDQFQLNHRIFDIAVGIFLDATWHDLQLPDDFALCFHKETTGPNSEIIGKVCRLRSDPASFIHG
jgi:hypothetical protein